MSAEAVLAIVIGSSVGALMLVGAAIKTLDWLALRLETRMRRLHAEEINRHRITVAFNLRDWK